MVLCLRPAQAEDALCVWDMQRRSLQSLLDQYLDFEESPACESLDSVQRRLANPERSNYVIERDDVPVGAIYIADEGSGGRKRLIRLFILPRFQGRGYAQLAIREAERLHGEHRWHLDTILQEQKLCHLYEKMGYRQTGEIVPVSEKMSLVFYEKP